MSPHALRHLASRIALLAVLALALMPTAARLLAGGRDSLALCAAGAAGSPAPGDGRHAPNPCAYCALQADLAPPPAARALAAAARFVERRAAVRLAARGQAGRSTDQARAPPARA